MNDRWLPEFAEKAKQTDGLAQNPDHAALLAAGLMGEAGSVIAELKKEKREREAYPAYRKRMLEEIGDLLWYFVRLVDVLSPELLSTLDAGAVAPASGARLAVFLDLGAAVGEVVAAAAARKRGAEPPQPEADSFRRVWTSLVDAAREARISLEAAADNNIRKIMSRWPTAQVYLPLFDDDFPEEEQLPRRLDVEFRERSSSVVVLRCNGLNFGDRLTDNIRDPDGYRYHDVFHFAYAVHLGWSPVVRALLRCKRKSDPRMDEAQDGARAVILEEAVSAIVFNRAKKLGFFDGKNHVDYDLLKTVGEFTEGYEVENVSLCMRVRKRLPISLILLDKSATDPVSLALFKLKETDRWRGRSLSRSGTRCASSFRRLS